MLHRQTWTRSGRFEHLIFRKAVLRGGLNAVFDDYIVPNSARARQEIRSGQAVASGTAQWRIYFAENPDGIFETDVVFPQGSYEKGLYTRRRRH